MFLPWKICSQFEASSPAQAEYACFRPHLVMNDSLTQRITETSSLAQAICRAMQEEVVKLGLGDVRVGDPGSAVYRLSTDPASGQDSLLGEWRDQQGWKQGELTFHADGSFYSHPV